MLKHRLDYRLKLTIAYLFLNEHIHTSKWVMTPSWISFSQEHKVLKMCWVQNGSADSLSIQVINVYFWRTTGEIYNPSSLVHVSQFPHPNTQSNHRRWCLQCSKNIISQYNLLYMKTIDMFKIPETFRSCFSLQTIAPEETYCHQWYIDIFKRYQTIRW